MGKAVLPYLLALVPAVVVGGLIFLALGADPLEAFGLMLSGSFGSWYRFSEVLVRSSPLVLTGLAVTVGARMAVWNIGAEGQLVAGAAAAAGTALYLVPGQPPMVALPAVVAAGFFGGMAWAAVPGLLRARLGVNEVITTLLLNYVAIIFMEHLYFGPWRDPAGFGFPGTAMFAEAARLPRLPETRVHLGLGLGLILAVLAEVLIRRTRWGYEIRVIGLGPRAAEYARMDIRSRILSVLLLSGGLAGLAGMAEAAGIHYRLQQGIAAGYGYDGIIVACLARFSPAAVPFAAVLLGGLIVGGEFLQARLHVPSSISLVLEGVILLGFLAGEVLGNRRMDQGTLPVPAAEEGGQAEPQDPAGEGK